MGYKFQKSIFLKIHSHLVKLPQASSLLGIVLLTLLTGSLEKCISLISGGKVTTGSNLTKVFSSDSRVFFISSFIISFLCRAGKLPHRYAETLARLTEINSLSFSQELRV